MARERQNNFSAGEIAPSLHSRTDLPQYGSAAKSVSNFFGTKFGTLLNRSGTRYVSRAVSDSLTSRLFTFNYSDDLQYVIEVSAAGYLSLTKDAGTLPGVPRYLAASYGTGANKSYIARTSAPAEDPTGTWNVASELTSAQYEQISVSDNGVIVAISSGTAYFAISSDNGATFTEYAHGKANFVAHSIVYSKVAALGDSAGRFYVAGRNSSTGYIEVYSSATGADGSWTAASITFGGVAYSLTSTRARLFASQDTLLILSTTSTVATVLVGYRGSFIKQVATATMESPSAYGNPIQYTVNGATYAIFPYYSGTTSTVKFVEVPIVRSTVGRPRQRDTGIAAQYCVLATDGTRMVLFGSTSYYSDDGGYTWSSVTTTALANVTRAIWFRDRFVIAGAGSTNYMVWTAPNTTLVPVSEYDFGVSGGTVKYVGLGAIQMPSVAYSFTVPWAADDLPKIQMFQSGDWCFFTCPGYAPQVLKRERISGGTMKWTLSSYFDEAPTAVVTGGSVTSTVPNSDTDHPAKAWSWKVAWVDDSGREGLPSAAITPSDVACYEDRPVTLQWTTFTGAERYHIYRGRNGLYGWVGTTIPVEGAATQTFKDDGQIPLVTRQPRTWDRPYLIHPPATGCFFQDRLCFANQAPAPTDIRLSYSGDYQGFDEKKDFSLPQDALLFKLASRKYEEVRALVPLEDQLFALTSEQEWLIGGEKGDAISFSDFGMKPVSSNGCAWVQPVVVGRDIVYAQSTGNVLRALGEGSSDLSSVANHLLSGYTIKEIHYAAVPYSVVWVVRSDGKLLSFSFNRESKSAGWGIHSFKDEAGAAAQVESATVVRESGEDVLWLLMYRPNSGSAIRTLERMAPRAVSSVASSTFLDCAVTGSGTSVACAHFTNGVTVGYLADGVAGTATVTAGAVTVPSCSRAVVGIPITATLTTLSSPQTITLHKQTPRVWVETDAAEWTWASATVGIKAASEGQTAYSMAVKDLPDGIVEIDIDTSTNPGGRVTVTVTDPIPVEIRGLVREVVEGA